MSDLVHDNKGQVLFYFEHLEHPTSIRVCHMCGSYSEGLGRGLTGGCGTRVSHQGAATQHACGQ
eukprot:1165062-Pyramimonas_sp.AAC.1